MKTFFYTVTVGIAVRAKNEDEALKLAEKFVQANVVGDAAFEAAIENEGNGVIAIAAKDETPRAIGFNSDVTENYAALEALDEVLAGLNG